MGQLQKKILIVDDIKMNREILGQIFNDNFHIIEASNGKEALDLMETEREDIVIILLDICMPIMDGLEALWHMKERKWIESIPVIMITSENSSEILEKGFRLGASEVIQKPFITSIIKKRVDNLTHIKNHKSETDKLKAEAYTDPLTKLLNRRALEKNIKEALLDTSLKRAALCLMDIDNFKQYNDQYGHRFGDKALTRVSEQLIKTIRKEDIVGRVGGDEFVVFLRNIRFIEEVETRMQEVCGIFIENYKGTNISSSIGIAVFPDHGNEYNRLFDKADKALYQAKNAGKTRCIIYDEEFQDMPFQSAVSDVEC